jgi:hypothetical protein
VSYIGKQPDVVAVPSNSSITNAQVAVNAAIEATKLSFTQSGTGAVARTVESKLRDAVSVKDFGAVGDGTTDDTAAIQAAVNSASSAVYFPQGVYICAGLSISNATALIGESRTSSVLKLKNSANTYIAATSTYVNNQTFANLDVVVKSLTFDGNKANNTSGSGFISKCYRASFEDVGFNNAASYGCVLSERSANGTLNTNGLAENSWFRCYFENNALGGLYADNDANQQIADGVVSECVFNGNGTASPHADIFVERAAGWKILDCQLYSGGFHSIRLQQCSRAVISGNHIELNATGALTGQRPCAIVVESWSNPSFLTSIGNNVILLNHTGTATATGIHFVADTSSSGGVSVVGNTIDTYTSGEAYYLPAGAGKSTWLNSFGNAVSEGSVLTGNWIGARTGSFTPGIVFATNGDFAPVYTVQHGRFWRLGTLVYFQLTLEFSANAYSTASGVARITGLPFASVNEASSYYLSPVVIGPVANVTFSSTQQIVGAVTSNSTVIELRLIQPGISPVALDTSCIPASRSGVLITASGMYQVAV